MLKCDVLISAMYHVASAATLKVDVLRLTRKMAWLGSRRSDTRNLTLPSKSTTIHQSACDCRERAFTAAEQPGQLERQRAQPLGIDDSDLLTVCTHQCHRRLMCTVASIL